MVLRSRFWKTETRVALLLSTNSTAFGAANLSDLGGTQLVQFATSAIEGTSISSLRRKVERRHVAHLALDDAASAVAAAGAPSNATCPYTVWEAVERIAALFRMYPSDGKDLKISLPGAALLEGAWADRAPDEVKQRIATSNVLTWRGLAARLQLPQVQFFFSTKSEFTQLPISRRGQWMRQWSKRSW